MDFEHIAFAVESRIARLTLKRAPLNILDIAMMREINHALELVNDEAVKLLVIGAEGRNFSAGVSIEEHTRDKVDEMISLFHGIFRHLDQLSIPTLAAVQGAALGGGCELALFCDMVIAADNARFGQPEIKAGVFPPIAAVILPRLVSSKRALELLLTGEPVDATEACRLGLVNKVVPLDQLPAATENMIGSLQALSGSALRLTMRAARAGVRGSFSTALDEVEALYLKDLMSTHDASEGLSAFLEKRPPSWTDR